MGTIGIDQLKPGMVLAEDLKSPQGRLLLHKGSEVTEAGLRTCRIWGIAEAEVEGVEDASATPDLDAAPEDLREACEAVVDARFAYTDPEHPAVAELKRLALRDCVLRHMEGGGAPEPFTPPRPDARAHLEDISRASDLSAPDVLGREVRLASLPDIFVRIVEAIKHPASSASYVADVIGKDAALSAKLLNLVNSAFYGFPRRIDTLARAVTIIGSNHLTNLAMGVSVLSMFEDIPPEHLDMRSFWEHSLGCGLVARQIASHLPGNHNEERYFVAGLLHDIGRLVLVRNLARLYGHMLLAARSRRLVLADVELQGLGFRHDRVSGLLCREWRLPETLEKAVMRHHNPGAGREGPEPCVIHLADILAHAMPIGHGGNEFVPPLDEDAWESLGLSQHQLGPILLAAGHQLDDTMRIFFGGVGRAEGRA